MLTICRLMVIQIRPLTTQLTADTQTWQARKRRGTQVMCRCSRPTFSIPHHLLLAGSCATENGIYFYYVSIAGPLRVCRSCHTAKGITTHSYTCNQFSVFCLDRPTGCLRSSPGYNRSGWLSIKHQVSYLLSSFWFVAYFCSRIFD